MTDPYRTAYETLAAAIRSAYQRDRGVVENIAAVLAEEVRKTPDTLDVSSDRYAQLPHYAGMAYSLRALIFLVDRLDQDLTRGNVNDLTNNIGGAK